MNRRSFVKSLSLTAGFLAVSGFDFSKKKHILYGDGNNDDSESIQAYLDGEENVFYADGTKVTETLRSGTYKITRRVRRDAKDRTVFGQAVSSPYFDKTDYSIKRRIIKNCLAVHHWACNYRYL
jgi:hypothetical protein